MVNDGLSSGLRGFTLAFALLQAVHAFEVTELGPLLRLLLELESPESFEPLGPAAELVRCTPERLAFLEWAEPGAEPVALGGSCVLPGSDDVAAPRTCVFSCRLVIGRVFSQAGGIPRSRMPDGRRQASFSMELGYPLSAC